MLHKPKISTLKHLHSIPRYFMHSIPIGSLVALLTLTLFTINPSPHSNIEAYAIEDTNVRDTISTSNSSNSDLDTVEREDSTVSKTNEDGDSDISLQAASTLNISKSNLVANSVHPGSVAYLDSEVTYSAGDVNDYVLQISYASGYNSLKLYNGDTILTGANGNKPSTMPEDSWGFGWGSTNANEQDLTYYTMPSYGTIGSNISTGKLEASDMSGSNPSATKKIVFAAKFSSTNSNTGHYQTGALLSLTAKPSAITPITYKITFDCGTGATNCPANVTENAYSTSFAYTIPSTTPTGLTKFLGWSNEPAATSPNPDYAPGSTIHISSSSPNKIIYAVWELKSVQNWNDLEYLQQMSTTACTNAPLKKAISLTDLRDNNAYSIMKLDDGKCWMTQNLRISGRTISSADSNVLSHYSIPASSDIWNDKTATDANLVHYTGNVAYGAYYTWCTATAGSCTSVTEEGVAASYSICPKGWRLPTQAEYGVLVKKVSGGWSDYGYSFAGAFFPAAGQIYPDTNGQILNDRGSYWSSTGRGVSNAAYYLFFRDNIYAITSANSSVGNNGLSVRCIAE